MINNQQLILGSSSVFRRQQLQRLCIPFQAITPCCDETPHDHESAADTALRLAEEKVYSLASQYPHALIIGTDQVAWCHSRQFGKPLTLEVAKVTLRQLSGQKIQFFSAMVLLNVEKNRVHRHIDQTVVTMRPLTESCIDYYLSQEKDALRCAGAVKSEGLGTWLIQNIQTTDPNALIGLPLFKLVDFLMDEGITLS